MRNLLLRAFVIGSLLVIALGMPLLLAPHRIRVSSAKQITTGMTIADLVDLLGVQPGCYDGYDLSSYGNFGSYRLAPGTAVWCSRHCWVVVRFDLRPPVDMGRRKISAGDVAGAIGASLGASAEL